MKMTIEEALADLEKTRRSALSHELRQPLAAMKTWVELLDRSLGDSAEEKQRRYVTKVRAEIDRLAGLFDRVSHGEEAPNRVGASDD